MGKLAEQRREAGEDIELQGHPPQVPAGECAAHQAARGRPENDVPAIHLNPARRERVDVARHPGGEILAAAAEDQSPFAARAEGFR